MKVNAQFDREELLNEAIASDHHEGYHILEKTVNFRIGVGARLDPSNQPHFFIEILLYMTPDDERVDVMHLKRIVSALKRLQARHSSMVFQDGNCISCERQVSPERLQKEYAIEIALMKETFKN